MISGKVYTLAGQVLLDRENTDSEGNPTDETVVIAECGYDSRISKGQQLANAAFIADACNGELKTRELLGRLLECADMIYKPYSESGMKYPSYEVTAAEVAVYLGKEGKQ